MNGVPDQSEPREGSRWSPPRAARWVLVEAPARLYMAGERSGGSVPWPFFAAMALLAATGAGLGAIAAAALGHDLGEWASGGLLVGIFVMLAWSLYAILALVVMWVLSISPEQAERGDPDRRGHPSDSRGRHAAPLSWRSRGDRLVPGGLVAFFLLMAGFGVLDWAWSQHDLRHVPSNHRVVTTGRVLEFRDPPFYGKGAGSIVVSFEAGTPITTEVSGDVGEHSIDIGDTVPIEYDGASPTRARVTWTGQSVRDDLAFAKGLIAAMGVLAALSAAAWLAGGRRARREP